MAWRRTVLVSRHYLLTSFRHLMYEVLCLHNELVEEAFAGDLKSSLHKASSFRHRRAYDRFNPHRAECSSRTAGENEEEVRTLAGDQSYRLAKGAALGLLRSIQQLLRAHLTRCSALKCCFDIWALSAAQLRVFRNMHVLQA